MGLFLELFSFPLILRLGRYFLHSPALDIPHAVVGDRKTYDTSLIERSKISIKSVYSRDQYGYRPSKNGLGNRGTRVDNWWFYY